MRRNRVDVLMDGGGIDRTEQKAERLFVFFSP